MELRKALLQEVSGEGSTRTVSEGIRVQFNPATLRLVFNNRNSREQTLGQQTRQFLGAESTTLSLELIFDTADEAGDNNGAPRSVREKTALVEKFMLPRGQASTEQSPPRVRFSWGDLVVEGMVESLSIDFDHFAADGKPLRAKAALSIREQDPRYALRPTNNTRPSDAGTGAGGARGSDAQRSAPALAGESAADFAARVGLDPAAWRGLTGGLDNPLSLQAGVEIGFSANLQSGAGIGLTLGVQAGASLSLEANLGLEAGARATSGIQLAGAGGVGNALETVKMAYAGAAQEQARRAFSMPGSTPTHAAVASAGASATAVASEVSSIRQTSLAQARTTLKSQGLPTPSRSAQPAPLPSRVDPRALSFAYGVPLRPNVGEAADRRAGSAGGAVPLRARTADGGPQQTYDPTTPGWKALPASALTAAASRSLSRRGTCQKCRGHCGCRGGA